jgi:hypothetical protein
MADYRIKWNKVLSGYAVRIGKLWRRKGLLRKKEMGDGMGMRKCRHRPTFKDSLKRYFSFDLITQVRKS